MNRNDLDIAGRAAKRAPVSSSGPRDAVMLSDFSIENFVIAWNE